MTVRSALTPILPILLLVCSTVSTAPAEPLWQKLIPGERVEANPNADYYLTEREGPWFVLATTFSGEGAVDQAHQLVLELRSRYKLTAYMHEMKFDFSKTINGRGVDPTGQPLRMKYQRAREIKEIAVLVGNFSSVDDPKAQETLRKIKHMRPETLSGKDADSKRSLSDYRKLVAKFTNREEVKKKGPMGMAFVTRNPILPQEYFVPQGIDKFVEKINSDVKYSLLQCQGQYTVKVATFNGKLVIDQKAVHDFEAGKQNDTRGRLEQAGEDAERLVYALRKKGYEAYVLHDRGASMVTVGSFESIGNRLPNGKIDLDPRIHAVMKNFAATPAPTLPGKNQAAVAQSAFKLKSLVGIPFDIQPEIVKVPHRSIASDYRSQSQF